MLALISKYLTTSRLFRKSHRSFFVVAINSFFTGSFISIIIDYLAGSLVNYNTLGAIQMMDPIVMLNNFICSSLMVGFASVYVQTKSKIKEKSNNIFYLGILTGLLVGIVCFFVLICMGYLYSNIFATNDQYSNYFVELLTSYKFVVLINPIYSILYYLVFYSGGNKHNMVGDYLRFFVNVILVFILLKKTDIGLKGIPISVAISYLAEILVLLLFYIKKKNRVSFSIGFEINTVKQILSIGFSSSFMILAQCLYSLSINLILTRYFEPSILVTWRIANTAIKMFFIGSSTTTSLAPLLNAYIAQENQLAVRKVEFYAIKFLLICGIVYFAIIFFAAPWYVSLFKITDSSMVDLAIDGLRINALAVFFIFLCAFYNRFLSLVNRPKLSSIIACLNTYLFPVLVIIVLGYAIGKETIFMGRLLGSALSLLVIAIITFIYYKKGLSIINIDFNYKCKCILDINATNKQEFCQSVIKSFEENNITLNRDRKNSLLNLIDYFSSAELIDYKTKYFEVSLLINEDNKKLTILQRKSNQKLNDNKVNGIEIKCYKILNLVCIDSIFDKSHD